jgi:synaptobrevin family protein YKT6
VAAQEKQFMFFTFRKNEVVTIIITSEDYPSRAAFSIIREIMSEYEQCGGRFPGGKSSVIHKGIKEYQQPANADKLLKIQQNLDEIQKTMIQNLEAAIGRGQSLSQLAEKSEAISNQSKLFAREAHKMNRCCSVI